ncbi:MAG TPA: 4-oxalocrotonate tautomerase DmpI [Magnetospirillum sp.]|nr:4-oxalocrotonate tautomerase DmpI [Magnetospirillum sp.]
MPLIVYESGQMTKELKAELIQQLTQTAARVTGIPAGMFFVSIHELPDDDIAVGGVTVTELKRQLAEKRAAASAE